MRDQIVKTLDVWLEPHKIKDFTHNGLQFEGKTEVKKVACAVDVSLQTLTKASELDIDLLITHHGMIWGGLNKITSFDKDRIQVLCDNQINLYCSHLPLDIHPQFGNNACLIELLGAENTLESFFDVGYYANIDTTYTQLKTLLRQHVSENLIEMHFGEEQINKIAICSGALDLKALFEAHQHGVHHILTGETSSLFYHYAKELKMSVICAGHYATEIFGVNKINKEIKKVYPSLDITFIDFPTGF